MHKIFTYFQQLTQIPHCSHQADRLRAFLADFAQTRGYRVETDDTGNLLAWKGEPQLSLQAHYDMVCVGRAPEIETFVKDGWMMAKGSTLGADNGIAVAMMMALMEEGHVCEFLFTADEEVGLIGANALSFNLQSRYMLNLDSEDDSEVYIGCAGGIDLFARREYRMQPCDKPCYEITVSGLPGGHSGVEIHKNIPNAIKYFADYCAGKSVEIVSIEAGERINSIPVHVKAIVCSDELLSEEEHIAVKRLEGEAHRTIRESETVIEILQKAPHGVLAWNDALEIPDRSINLATVNLEEGSCEIALSARAMDDTGLAAVEQAARTFFEKFGFEVESKGKYPAWKPEINDFSKMVCEEVREAFGACRYKAIHAGLECAVISSHYPDIKIASIGPNIVSPHSTHERVEIVSVEKTYEVVHKIVERLAHA